MQSLTCLVFDDQFPRSDTEQKKHRVRWNSRDTVSILAGDETWLYYYNVLSKVRNKLLTFENEKASVQIRNVQSVKKRMSAIFFF